MKPLSRTEQRKLLLNILSQLGDPQAQGLLAYVKRRLYELAFGVVLLVVVLGAVIESDIYKIAHAGLAFLLGLGFGIVAWRLSAARNWAVVSGCIDRSRVEAKLRELDA